MKLQQEYRETTIINKSRFIACVSRCDTEEEARFYIDGIRREFPDSSHVCTAYMLGDNGQVQRSSDNGEPAGTAGVPMLEAIRKSGLQNVCACVVRYFGGIKLGAGGLIRAYGNSVSRCLEDAVLLEDVEYGCYKLVLDYETANKIDHYLRNHTIDLQTAYDVEVTYTFAINDGSILNKISEFTKGLKPSYIGKQMIATVVK